jgi:hypothetical protein
MLRVIAPDNESHGKSRTHHPYNAQAEETRRSNPSRLCVRGQNKRRKRAKQYATAIHPTLAAMKSPVFGAKAGQELERACKKRDGSAQGVQG